jgi:hypothetical protein
MICFNVKTGSIQPLPFLNAFWLSSKITSAYLFNLFLRMLANNFETVESSVIPL